MVWPALGSRKAKERNGTVPQPQAVQAGLAQLSQLTERAGEWLRRLRIRICGPPDYAYTSGTRHIL